MTHYYTEILWDVRYPPCWKELARRTHRATNGVCCCCKRQKSTSVHHSRYLYLGDTPGKNIFGVCQPCHDKLCHSPKNWIKHKGNPLWKSRNTPEWESRLKAGFKELAHKEGV